MASVKVRRTTKALNGLPSGSLVYLGGGSGGGGTPTPGTNLLATRSAAIESGDVTAAANVHGPNVSLSSVASSRVPGRTKALRVTLTGTGNDSGASFYFDSPTSMSRKTYKITVVGSRYAGAADLYKDVYVTLKWRKPKANGATGTDYIYEYQGGAVDSGTSALTTSTFVAVAPLDAITVGVIVRYPGGSASGGGFDVHDVKLEELTNYPNPTEQYEVAFCRPRANMFATDNIWDKRIESAPLASDSDSLISTLINKDLVDGGGAVFNLLAFASSTYVVGPDHPLTTIGFEDAQHKQYTPGELYSNAASAFRGLPIPWEAVSGGGGDSHMTAIQLGTDGKPKLLSDVWQFYKDRAITLQEGGVTPSKAAAGDYTFKNAAAIAAAGDNWNGFSATWGGKIMDVSQNNGIFPPNTGTSATGIVAAGGTVGILEAQAGAIEHALYMSIVYPRGDTWSYPAQRSDGFVRNASQWPYIDPAVTLREGQRVRLDPSLDLSTLNLAPMGRMIATALQKYGAIVGDKTGAVEFEGESPRPYLQRGLPNPWDAILGSQNIYQNFPWNRLQAVAVDWGKP